MPTIPARSFAFQPLKSGQAIKIIDTAGGQVIDTWAFSLVKNGPFPTYMSMTHTRSTLHTLLPAVHESFLDNRRNPILRIVEDTSPRTHDVLFAACSPERYLQLGSPEDHDSCARNLYQAVKMLDGSMFGDVAKFIEFGWMPDPLNLFMNVGIDGGKLECLDPQSRPGDYVVLQAEQDCVVIMSACPMDVSACNGGEPTTADYQIVAT